ncbi:MAG: hypothetical protein JKP96_06950 [Oceanicaulis sp.]|nr:hypothetical protein [Oceanicaulis sp.]
MMDFPATWIIAGLAALLGVGMGLGALIVPRWAQSVVRLAPDPRWKGGWSEFRASYGGALLLLHAAVLLTIAMSFQAGAGAVMGASFAASCYWLGMVIGRALSMLTDAEQETRTSYNAMALGFELVMAGALGAPFLSHLGG